MPFLTLIDPHARLKGSRDPLGFQPLWTRLGRRVITNLTTVTTSLRGFTTLLLGLYFANQWRDEHPDADADLVPAFLKMEQLAAYSRVALRNDVNTDDEDEVRGIRRVQRNLRENDGVVRISARPQYQILDNQRTYGLWGLYSSAARSSGWLEAGEPRLTLAAREFVEAYYLPRLEKRGQTFMPFLDKDREFHARGQHKTLAGTLANLLAPQIQPQEIAFYRHHLLYAAAPSNLQTSLWKAMRALGQHGRIAAGEAFSMSELRALIEQSNADGNPELAQRLEEIRVAETVLAPAAEIFGLVLARDAQSIPTVAGEIERTWGTRLTTIAPDAFHHALVQFGDTLLPGEGTRLLQLASALADANYQDAIALLLKHNEEVMQARHGGAWVRVENNRLDVRLRAEERSLTPASDLPDLWLNPYFLNALKRLGMQIEGV